RAALYAGITTTTFLSRNIRRSHNNGPGRPLAMRQMEFWPSRRIQDPVKPGPNGFPATCHSPNLLRTNSFLQLSLNYFSLSKVEEIDAFICDFGRPLRRRESVPAEPRPGWRP